MNKVIVNEGKKYTVDPLYQWDLNQELQIYGVNIADPQIHFSNEGMSASIVVEPFVDTVGVITVDIPNSLLQKSGPINVYICGYEGATFKTYYKITVPVKARSKPGDYTLENDGEVYSFKDLSKRVSDLEKLFNSAENLTLYHYSSNGDNTSLIEAKTKSSMPQYLQLVSTSLKAIKSITDKFRALITTATNTANKALSTAESKSRTITFNTFSDMTAWLSEPSNALKCDVGDNLYIIDENSSNWFVTEVLDNVDEVTGYYYKIAKVGPQKADLTTTVLWTNPDTTVAFDAQTVTLDLTEYKRFSIILKMSPTDSRYVESVYSHKDLKYYSSGRDYGEDDHREFTITDNGVSFENGYSGQGTSNNSYMIPYQIVGYKY